MTIDFLRRSRAAFGLLEVIVSCAVLGVLIYLAFPVLAGAGMTAKRTACAANLRQIGGAITLYAAEHNGRLPVTSHTTGSMRRKVNGQWVYSIEGSWIYQLANYLGNLDDIRVCPADEPERRKEILTTKGTSYLLNDIVFDNEAYQRLTQLPSPTRTMIAFISNRPISETWDHAHCANWVNWPAINADIAPDRHRKGRRAPDYTNGSANYLYADGHVETLTATTFKSLMESGARPWIPQ